MAADALSVACRQPMGVGAVCGAPVGRWCRVQGGVCPRRRMDAERVAGMVEERDRIAAATNKGARQ